MSKKKEKKWKKALTFLKLLVTTNKELHMDIDTNKDRQRKFKSKMYEAGFKRIYFWVKKETAGRLLNAGWEAFAKKMEKLLSGFSPAEQGKMLALLVKIIEGKKEVLKLRKKKKNNEPEARGGGKERGQ